MDAVITPKGFAEYLEQTTNLLKSANTLSSDYYRRFCLERSAPIHPARMPPRLVEFFIKFLTDEGDKVLDPFAGSNTTGAVAQELGRRWLSIEADWNYAAHSIGRFDPTDLTRTCEGFSVREVQQKTDLAGHDHMTTPDAVCCVRQGPPKKE